MPVWIAKINPAPAIIMVNGHIIRCAGAAAIFDILGFYPLENVVKFLLGDFERIVNRCKCFLVVEIQAQRVIDTYYDEMGKRTDVFKTKYATIEFRRFDFIEAGHNGVIQGNRHLFSPSKDRWTETAEQLSRGLDRGWQGCQGRSTNGRL
ncbi:hypothetical protein NSMM_420022 [Nitrosomonas mobilis]|uniref:Uncharacterized protein n=1 Tax=Nitrosomonas mobilis TaxID=51642 RepID=A0A1G5SFC5_9PROT|nr:hypothetical protein NSMM_420022 [Nitrosomonas mobilis]